MWVQVTLLLALCLKDSHGSHFEGGTISFAVVSGNTVQFDWSQGWRLGAGPCCSSCSAASIGTLGSCNQGSWMCVNGCSGTLAPVIYTVTGINTVENWEQGVNSFTHTFSGNGPFTIDYTSCCWRTLNYGPGTSLSWTVQVTFSLGARSDTGQANSAPKTASSPIYRNQYGCGKALTTIPMIDGDNDIVVCRWAIGSECNTVCNATPNSVLVSNGNNCELTMNTSGSSVVSGGWYATAITLEDFPRTGITMGGTSYSQSNALSSVPLQFMIYTPTISVSCSANPVFVNPTPAAGASFSVLRGSTLSVTISAQDTSGYPVTGITVTGPAGGSLSPSSGVTNSGGKTRTIVWSWSPSASQSGGQTLCFTAVDGIGKVSAFTCCRIAIAVICPDPGFGSNVNRNPSSSPTFYFGDVVTYGCTSGYQYSSGTMSRTCQLNAAFDGSAPVCTIISCGTPAVGTGARKLSGTAFTYNQVTTFGCNTGYTFLSGSSSRTCQTSSAWSGSTYTCDRVNCGDPGTPSNGARTGADFKYTGVLTFSCNTGYYVSNGGSTSRTCQSNAVWSGTQPVCSKVRCPDPGLVQNSTRVMNPIASVFEYLDTVTYNPHPGYQIRAGSKVQTCQATQIWSGTNPAIRRISCPTLTGHNNATQTGFAYRYLDYISWTCNIGYKRSSGDYKVMCQANFAWNGTTLQCTRITCPILSAHNNATQTGTGFRYLDNVSWQCHTGYERDSGDYNVQCQSNGAWNGTAVLQCKRITCSPAYTPHNNATQTGYAYRYLDHISWTCHTGYERDTGDFNIQCLSTKAWNGTQLTCKRITCPTLVAHNNVTQTGTSFRYLDSVSWTLHTGYERDSGDFNVKCQANRAWNGTRLIAKRITCPSLVPHNNATQTGFAFRYLDHVSWACHTGYERDTGDYHVQCQANRAWNGTVLQCKRITCPSLVPHNNATQTGFAYRYLDHVSWQCHTGYERDTGDFNVQCQANRAWNGTVLQCKRITCPTLAPHNNATQTGTSYRYLDYVSWSCNTGYEISGGDYNVQCQANRAWNGTVLHCKRIICSPHYTPHNNATQTGYYYRYLDHIRWTCHTGYERDTGDFNIQCLASRAWNGTRLACKRITCPTLVPDNNVTQTGLAYRYLDYVGWTLHTGYERDTGDFNVQCQPNRAWNGTKLISKRVTCPNPPYVSNSSVLGSDFKYLSITTYKCDYGYEIKNGTETRACMAPLGTCNTYGASCPGWWNGTLPVCGRKECFNMTNPRDAHVVSNHYGPNINTRNHRFFYLDTILWACDAGFTRKSGDWVQTCLGTAVWNGTSPTCEDVDECRSSPCNNNAICLNLVNKFQCLCVNGFSGSICQIPPTMSPNLAQGGTNPFNLKTNQYQASTAGNLMPSHGSLLLVLAAVVWKHMI